MTKNKHSRLAKLEAQTSIGKWHLVLPHCTFYMNSEEKTCTCYPYYTQEPYEILKGMKEFYDEVNSPCKPLPADVLSESEFKELGLRL